MTWWKRLVIWNSLGEVDCILFADSGPPFDLPFTEYERHLAPARRARVVQCQYPVVNMMDVVGKPAPFLSSLPVPFGIVGRARATVDLLVVVRNHPASIIRGNDAGQLEILLADDCPRTCRLALESVQDRFTSTPACISDSGKVELVQSLDFAGITWRRGRLVNQRPCGNAGSDPDAARLRGHSGGRRQPSLSTLTLTTSPGVTRTAYSAATGLASRRPATRSL